MEKMEIIKIFDKANWETAVETKEGNRTVLYDYYYFANRFPWIVENFREKEYRAWKFASVENPTLQPIAFFE